MGSKSKIEWTDATWNPVTGCDKVSTGCKNCYAEKYLKRFHGDNGFAVTLHENRLSKPDTWKNPRIIFVCSLGDLFHEDVPFNFIDKIFSVIERNKRHTFIILTKRPENAKVYYDDRGISKPYLNVWFGISAENQETADIRVPVLLQIPAIVRFVSAEPLLGYINLSKIKIGDISYIDALKGFGYGEMVPGHSIFYHRISWVIVGGESGNKARPMHPDWAISLRNQCDSAGIPFFFKQWGEWAPAHSLQCNFPEFKGKTWYVFDPGTSVCKIGKKKAGNKLDGKVYNEHPKI